MTLGKFAWNNVMRDKRSYIAYFISSMCSVFIFFSFAVSMFHPNLSVIEAGSSLFLALLCGSIVVYLFSFLFLGYSMNAFFQTRKKQFGLITFMGASKKQMNRLIFIENMTIGLGAILCGIGLGILFARIFLLMEEKMIKGIAFPMYMPVKAIIITIVLFGFLFFAISVLIPQFLRKQEIIALLKTEIMEEKQEKHTVLCLCIGGMAFLCFLGLLLGQGKIMEQFRNTSLFPVVLLGLIMIITYIFFRNVLGSLLRFVQKTNLYYKRTNLIVCSGLIGKLKENAQMMFLTCILCAVSFIVMVGFTVLNEGIYDAAKEKIPYAHCFIVDKPTKKANELLIYLKNELKGKEGYMEAEFELLSRKNSHESAVLSEMDYKNARKLIEGKQIHLKENEVFLLSGNAGEKSTPNLSEADKKELKSIMPDIHIAGTDKHLLLVSGSYTKYVVVKNAVFAKLKENKDYELQTVHGFQTKNWKTEEKMNQRLTNILSKNMEQQMENGYRYSQRGYWYEVDKISGNLMQYVAFLLSFVFMIASASMIYFRIYTNLDKEIKKFKGIVKIGLSRQELSIIVGKELAVLLLLPFFAANLYMWCGIGTAGHLFHISIGTILNRYSIIFLLLGVILYEIIRRVYTKKLSKEVFGVIGDY